MKRPATQSVLIIFLAVAVSTVSIPVVWAQGDAAGVYASKCAACHGADGSASTPAGKAVQARDFHSADVQSQSDADLTAIVTKGKNKMPAYEKILNGAQIKDLVAYCRALGKKG